jgi:hypothetical protein
MSMLALLYFYNPTIFVVSEASKGCTLFTVSRQGMSPLRLAYSSGRRAVLMKWRHQEEWISLTTDTANGFDLEAELNLQETPTLLTILGGINLTPSPRLVTQFYSAGRGDTTIKRTQTSRMCLFRKKSIKR